MGSYLSIYTFDNNGKKKHVGNYRCRPCARKHMIKNRPTFILDQRGKMVMYNAEYKVLARKKGWKLEGQQVRR